MRARSKVNGRFGSCHQDGTNDCPSPFACLQLARCISPRTSAVSELLDAAVAEILNLIERGLHVACIAWATAVVCGITFTSVQVNDVVANFYCLLCNDLCIFFRLVAGIGC